MFRRKKYDDVFDDNTTNRLMTNGLYSVNGPDYQEEGFFSKLGEHNLLMGMWYVFILSCMLWWLPLFGPMLAGYIGGRRAGSPTKGVFVALIPVSIILLLLIGFDAGVLPFLGALVGIPNAIVGGFQSLSPHAASYLSGMYSSLGVAAGMNGNGFFIIVIFGYIGGMMADMNSKEIAKATGSPHFLDGFMGKFPGAGLSKLADMVTERVMWSIGAISGGGRNMIARAHPEPGMMGFEDLKRLPASTSTNQPYMDYTQDMAYQPEPAYGYEDTPPHLEEYLGNDSYEDDLISYDIPKPVKPKKAGKRKPRDDEWGVSHCDISEESMIDSWKDLNKDINKKKKSTRYRRDVNKTSMKLNDLNKVSNSRTKEKRDALIYENKGKPLYEDDSESKAKLGSLKKKLPSLVTRALAADEKIKTQKETEEEPDITPLNEPIEETKPLRPRPIQSFDRL